MDKRRLWRSKIRGPAASKWHAIYDYESSTKNPGRMRRTDTLDIIFVVDGKIDMGLDKGKSVTLNKGDVMVQQGTNLSWDNSYKEPCRLAIVLIDGKVGAVENTA